MGARPVGRDSRVDSFRLFDRKIDFVGRSGVVVVGKLSLGVFLLIIDD